MIASKNCLCEDRADSSRDGERGDGGTADALNGGDGDRANCEGVDSHRACAADNRTRLVVHEDDT